METLPPEITFDILSRLPVESLAQAKYVSKLWNSIINNPSFATAHFSHQNNNKPGLIFRFNLYSSKTPHLNLFLVVRENPEPHFFLPLLPDYTVAGSANGILCLVGPHITDFDIYLCNPLLNEFLTVPVNPRWPQLSRYDCFTAFGFDPSTGSYKVVRFFKLREQRPRNVGVDSVSEICTIRADDSGFSVGSWRPIQNPPYKLSYSCVFFMNNRFHLLTNYNAGSNCIVCLDVQSEEFGVLPSPVQASWHDHMRLGNLGGRLCMFNKRYEAHIDVWVMEEYGKGESWVKQYMITPNSRSYRIFSALRSCEPLCFLENEEFLIYYSKQIFTYNFRNDVLRELRVHWNHIKPDSVLEAKEALLHTCSIISLKRV